MMDTVEHIGLDHGVMYHIFEDDSFAYLQFVVEAPKPHVVAAQAGIAAKTVDVRAVVTHPGATNGGLVGHFQAVGHVAGEADVENGGADAAVFYNIYDFGRQYAGLPGEGGTGFEDDAQMRIARFQSL